MSEIEDRDVSSAEIADEALAEHLVRRGGRPAPKTLAPAIVARIAETAPERRWRLTLRAWEPRLAVLALGSALVLVVSVLYFGGTTQRNVGPSRSPSPSTSFAPIDTGVTWDPTQRALTPPEFARIMETQPVPGTILIVDDQIIQSCEGFGNCPTGVLANASGVVVEPLPGSHFPASADGGQTSRIVSGPLALRIDPGQHLVFLGSMVSNGLRLAFTAHDLLTRNAMGGLFVIPGWLWGTPPAPCPSRPGTPEPMPTSELGLPAPRLECVPISWLTDSETTDPGRGGGVGFPVQDGAFQSFAPPPVVPPLVPPVDNGNGVAPWAIYLVRDWAGYGEILGRLQPLGIPGPLPTEPTTPSPGVVMSVDQLVADVMGGRLPPGSIAIASISGTDVSSVETTGPRPSDDALEARWAIAVGSRSLRVDVAKSNGLNAGPTSIIGTQAFVVEDAGAIRALGPAWIGGIAGAGPTQAPADGAMWVVQGWLRLGITQPLPCPAPMPTGMTGLLGEPLGWSGCPGAWIADSPFGASGPDGTVLSDEAPNGALHVQDGAGDASFQPQLSAWLVRSVVTGCPDGPSCPSTLAARPPANATWWELVGPISGATATPETPAPPTPQLPTQPASPVVFDQAGLLAAVSAGTIGPDDVVVADVSVTPVSLPTYPSDRGEIVGFVGSLVVHWNAEAGTDVPGTGRYAFRLRADGGLDFFGPPAFGTDVLPFETQTAAMPAPGQHLVVAHGWVYQGPPEKCLLAPSVFNPPLGIDGQVLDYSCDDAWIQPTGASPEHQTSNGYELRMPSGAVLVQAGALPLTRTPREGVFLLRYHPCLNGPIHDVCQVAGPGEGWEYVGTLSQPLTATAQPQVGSVPYSVAVDDPTWDRLDDPRGVAAACFGASDCGSYDPWYPGVARGPDVDLSRSIPLRLAGYVVVDVVWDGSNLVVHVHARTGGYQEVVIDFARGSVRSAKVVVIDDRPAGRVVTTIPIP